MKHPSFLEEIQSPSDLRKLDPSQLPFVAEEIRERLLQVVSETGGHLASGLGAVEITLALHWVFQSPTDTFIFDVGHQTYPHKILTGRNDRLPTLRKFEGLGPFQDPHESEHDPFHSGHAGTALSLALGMAKNRDLSNRKEHIIPIIGDASLTCGLSYEALNNLSRDLSRFIVILNDNEMSISRNVGAITRILSRMVSNPTLHLVHQEIDSLLKKIPSVGSALSNQGHKLLESVKNLFSSKAFFEQYGLSYIGPHNGHDVHKLIDVFTRVKDSQWPVIIHVITEKGHGMAEAANNPITWHGAKPFCLQTGKFHPSPSSAPTFPKIFGKTLLAMGEKDPSIMIVTPAMSCGSSLDAFMEAFPDRCCDVGIAESHAITFAGGLGWSRGLPSTEKRKVFASIYSTFLQRAFDNLFHDVCLQNIPVVFAIDRGGIAGGDGSSHNGIYDIGFLNAMPNMVIAQPRDGQLLVELVYEAHNWNTPVAIRYPNLPTNEAEDEIRSRPLGKGELLVSGKDLLIIALGHMNQTALEVRHLAAQEGIEVAVFDPIFLKPLDANQLDHLLVHHKNIVTLEEHSVRTGLGSIVNTFLIRERYRNIDVLNLGIPDIFVPHGQYKDLIRHVELSAEQVWDRIKQHFHIVSSKAPLSSLGALP